MAVKIGSNIAAIQAQRRLGEVTSKQSTIYERLASGSRINRASDDAATLSISSALNTDRKVLAQGLKNVSDGVSALSIAESALKSLLDISQRQKELAAQAASSVFSTKQRDAMQAEATALSAEYNRIVQGTSFNGTRLLEAGGKQINLQAGKGTEGVFEINLGQSLSVNQTTSVVGTSFNFTATAGGVGEQTTVVIASPSAGGYYYSSDEYSSIDLSTITPGATFTIYDSSNNPWSFEFVRNGDSPATGNYSIYYEESWVSGTDWSALENAIYNAFSGSGALTYFGYNFDLDAEADFYANGQTNTGDISGSGVTVSTTQQGGASGSYNPNQGTIQFQASDGTNYYVWLQTAEDDGLGGYNYYGSDPGGVGTALMVYAYANSDSAGDLASRIASTINSSTGGRVTASATGGTLTLLNNSLGNVTNSTASGFASIYAAGTKDSVLSGQAEVSRFSYQSGSSFLTTQDNQEVSRISLNNSAYYETNNDIYSQEVSQLTITGSGIASSESFTIYHQNAAYTFTFEVDGDYGYNSSYIQIESAWSESQVVDAVVNYLQSNYSTEFYTSSMGTTISIQSNWTGNETDSYTSGGSGLSISTTTQGGQYVTSYTTYPDLGAFKVYDYNGTSYEFYYVYTSSGQGVRFGDANYAFQIDVGNGDSASTILSNTASALQSAINSYGADFSYNNTGSYIDITQNQYGQVTDIDETGSEITATTTLQGQTTIPITTGYSRFYTPTTNYYVWYRVDGAGSNPNPGGTGIQVNISSNWSGTQIASAVASAINTATAGAVSASASGADVTITNSTVGPATNATTGNLGTRLSAYTITPGANHTYFQSTNHGMNTGDRVQYTTSGVAYGGLTSGSDYYVIRDSANTFRLATSALNAAAGTSVTLTSAGSGTQTINRYDGGTTSVTVLSAYTVDLSSVNSARTSLTELDAQMTRISNEIASIGTYQSRLGHTISQMRGRMEATAEAYARMTSADVAVEAADLVRTQIVQQSATSVLAQANQAPAIALALLRQ